MFRKMRRSVQALSHEEMVDLLKTETRGVMSVQGDNGYPYGFPINHNFCIARLSREMGVLDTGIRQHEC